MVEVHDKAAFEKWYWGSFIGPNPSPMSSDLIWERFRLHQVNREFPREMMGRRLDRAWFYAKELDNHIMPVSIKDGMLDSLERRWNGDQESGCSFCLGTGECQGGDACHGNKMHDCPICKGTGEVCPTCGGSGEVHEHSDVEIVSGARKDCNTPHFGGPQTKALFDKACPDCKPKCLRCGVSIHSAAACHFESSGVMAHRFVDQRRGEERDFNLRSAKAGEKFYIYNGDVGQDRRDKGEAKEKDSIYQRTIGSEHYPSPNQRQGEQRRQKDRRGKPYGRRLKDIINIGDRRTGDRRRGEVKCSA